MARRLHHIEIIPGRNGHTVRHFHAVNEGGTAAYQSESHVFGNVDDVANYVADTLEKHEEANEQKTSPKAEERKEASKADAPDAGKVRQVRLVRRTRLVRKTEMPSLFRVVVSAALSVALATAGGYGYFVWQRTHTPQVLFESGKKYYEQENYQGAMIQLEKAVRKDPRHKEAGLLLSRVYAALGNRLAAAAQLKALLEYYPYDSTLDQELGNLYRPEAPIDMRSFQWYVDFDEQIRRNTH